METIYDWVREWSGKLGAMTKALVPLLAAAALAGCASSDPYVSCLPYSNYQECVHSMKTGAAVTPRPSMSTDEAILLGTVLSGRGYQSEPPAPPAQPYDYAGEEARRQEQFRRQQEYERQLQWQRQQELLYQLERAQPGMRETYGP